LPEEEMQLISGRRLSHENEPRAPGRMPDPEWARGAKSLLGNLCLEEDFPSGAHTD